MDSSERPICQYPEARSSVEKYWGLVKPKVSKVSLILGNGKLSLAVISLSLRKSIANRYSFFTSFRHDTHWKTPTAGRLSNNIIG